MRYRMQTTRADRPLDRLLYLLTTGVLVLPTLQLVQVEELCVVGAIAVDDKTVEAVFGGAANCVRAVVGTATLDEDHDGISCLLATRVNVVHDLNTCVAERFLPIDCQDGRVVRRILMPLHLVRLQRVLQV